MIDQSGKTAWITGASSGLGEAMARLFLQAGGNCVLSGRNIDALENVAGEAPERALILPFDTSDYDALPDLAKQACAFRGGIDVLVNNAGISQRSLAADTDFAVYRQMIDIDLLAPIALSQAMLPYMMARKTGQYIMISSVAGKIGVPMRTAYCAAKHGLIGYGDALRSEVSAYGIKVLNVAPGSVKTNISRNALSADGSKRGSSDSAIEQGMDPMDVAKTIWETAATNKRELIIAEGMEAQLVIQRGSDPEKLFDMVDAMVAKGYVEKMQDT
jgi:dehydrogenase/reductase SDR family member 7B